MELLMARPSRFRAYGQNKPLIDVFPFPIYQDRAPTTTDTDFEIGQVWVHNVSVSVRNVYIFAGINSSTHLAIWSLTSPGTSEVDVLGASSGDASVSPAVGKITIDGTANQVVATGDNALAKITLSLPSAVTFPGSASATTSLSATTTVVAGTGITSTTGNIAASAGSVSAGTSVSATTTVTAGTDLVATAGNLLLNGAAKQVRIKGGAATDFIGTSVLTLGTVTIANTNIAAGDRIFLQRTAANASTTLGELVYTISAGASFTVTSLINGTPASTQIGDLSSFVYVIIRQL
jgi:hypothetical protein